MGGVLLHTIKEKSVHIILINPLTGEYFWAQQLTMFKWSQQVYT